MNALTELPEVVAATTSLYLELIDKALPGQVVGLYVTGSVPLGDFHSHTSDLPRLHALLATGEIVSKTTAGRHGAARFPDWASLCERCIDHRAGAAQQFTTEDAREAVAFGRAVIADALGPR